MPAAIVQEIQDQLDALGREVLQVHPHLRLENWSHSLGEANDLDGWTLGFVIHGLQYPLELAVDLFTVHCRPRVGRVMAEWLTPSDMMSDVWCDFNGQKSVNGLTAECREAVVQAVRGVAHQPHQGWGACATRLEDSAIRVKASLTQAERDIYLCWVAHIHQESSSPPLVWSPMSGIRFSPDSQVSAVRLAELLETRVEVVEALFPRERVCPELLAPFVDLVNWPSDTRQWRNWRQLYKEKPWCSGIFYVSPIGFSESRAVLLSANSTGGDEALLDDDLLDRALSIASFEKVGSLWEFRGLEHIAWRRAFQALVTGILFLGGAEWGELVKVDFFGQDLQPCLDLTWKLKEGREHKVQVVPIGVDWDGEALRVEMFSPHSVLTALRQHFQELARD